MSSMYTVILLALSLTLFTCAEDGAPPMNQGDRTALQNLDGTYLDETPYAYGEAFGQRAFTFNNGEWTLDFTLALDPAMELPVFRFRTFGTYEVLEASTVVPNAYNTLFREEKKFLTLLTDNPDLIQAFGFVPCGLDKGIERDISATGCSGWAAVADCNEDHDLLALDENGLLYFGERPADNNMCTPDRRPTVLTPPVTKQ